MDFINCASERIEGTERGGGRERRGGREGRNKKLNGGVLTQR
jgi:hypothetical protein